ncbi:GntR family transcriptional regulator [Pikeienuella sp. HZG-20]|uniref:GntR family transcriptional regulator n=1 Tax=Paludibacillus litoralis TaxID=3133267 RepID=UPI0030ED7211
MTDQVYAELRRRLLFGVLKPGEKISARSLGRTMGVSLTPARDAIARLVREGAIDVSATQMFSVPSLGKARYREIARLRLILEPLAVELASLSFSEDLADELEMLNEEMRANNTAESYDEALHLDAKFHLALYDATESSDLRRLIDGLWLLVGPTRTQLPFAYRQRESGYAHHCDIIAAIRMGDVVAAKEALTRDLTRGVNEILEILD